MVLVMLPEGIKMTSLELPAFFTKLQYIDHRDVLLTCSTSV